MISEKLVMKLSSIIAEGAIVRGIKKFKAGVCRKLIAGQCSDKSCAAERG